MQETPYVLGFTAGELSPWLECRFDLQAYQRGAALMQNFLVQPYGGVSRRPGTTYVGAAAIGNGEGCRLIPFCYSERDSMMLELYPGGMRVYRDGRLLCDEDGSVYEMEAPWSSAEEVQALRYTQVNDYVYITSAYREPHVLKRYGDTDWECTRFAPEPFPRETYVQQPRGMRVQMSTDGSTATLILDGGNAAFNKDMVNSEYLLLDAEVASQTLFLNEGFSFTTKELPDLAKNQVVGSTIYTQLNSKSKMYDFYTVIKPYLTSYYNGSPSARDYPDCFLPGVMMLNAAGKPYEVCGDWEVRTHGEWNAVWELWRSYDDSSVNLDFRLWEWSHVRTFEQNAYSERKNYAVSGSEDIPCRMVLVCRSASSASLPAHIYMNLLGGRREYRFLITGYTSAYRATGRLLSLYQDGCKSFYTHSWSFGAYGPRNGYPLFIGLHQGRLWMGGISGLPTTLIASTVNAFTDFRMTSADDGALHLTLATESQSRICWVCPARSLLVGTSESEWTLAAPDGGAITATNAAFVRQSCVGSEPLAAGGVENTVFYVQRGGCRLREISYKLAADGFTSTDTSLLAEHLFNAGVKEWVVQRGNCARLWVLMQDDSLAVLTMNAEQQVTAWQRVCMNGRKVLHLAALPARGNSEDEIWMLVHHEASGSVSVERMGAEALFVDGMVRVQPAEDGVVAPGAHLAGLPLLVYPEGQPQKAVSLQAEADGLCTIPQADGETVFCIGALFESELHTMPLETLRSFNTTRQEGRVRLRLLASDPHFCYKSTHAARWEHYDPAREGRSYPCTGEVRVSQLPEPGVGQGFALRSDGALDFRLTSMSLEFDYHGR